MEISLLKRVPIFSTLNERQLAKLCSLCVTRKCAKDSIILIEEEIGKTFFIISRGTVKVSHVAEDGREVILSILKTGDFFGEMSLLDGKARSASVTALEDSELLVLRRGDFLALLEEVPQISISLLRELAGRIREADTQIKSLTLHDAVGRVAACLIVLAEKMGRATGEAMIIPKIPIQRDLANMAGTARETVSRALKLLEEQGYVQKEGRRLLISEYRRFRRIFL